MKTLVTLVSLLLFTGRMSFAASATVWLAFPAGLNYDIVEKDGVASVRIPVAQEPKAPSVTELQARLRDVVFYNGRQEAISPTFEADFDGGDAHHGPSLVVRVKSLATRPGSYLLSLDIVRTNTETNQPEQGQSVTLMLQRPAPDIVLGPPVVAEQVLAVWGDVSNPGLLTLEERSGKASLTEVRFTQLPDPTTTTTSSGGELEMLLISNSVPPRTVVKASVLSHGNFPLGKSTGKIQIRARELEQPLVISYEVHTRRTRIWILVLVALGFAGGYLVRHVLRDCQEVAIARGAASDALREINDAEPNVGDEIFCKVLAELRKALIEDARRSQAAAIQAAAAKALQELSLAQKELADRVKQLNDQAQPLHACLHQKWQLPISLRPQLLAAVENIDAVAQFVAEQNAQAGSEKLKMMLEDELLYLTNSLGKWQREAGRYFAELNDAPPPLLDKGIDQLREATSRWTDQFGAAVSNNPAVTTNQLSTTLSSAHTAYGNALSIADNLRDSTAKLVQWVEVATSATCVALGLNLNDIKAVSFRASDLVKADLDHPDAARADLTTRHNGVLAAWKKFLVSIIPPEVDASTINDALDCNQWIEAVKAAGASTQRAQPAGSAAIAKAAIAMPSPIAGSIVFAAAPVSSDGTSDLVLVRKRVLSGSALEKDFFMRQMEKASLVQTLIFGGLFMAIAYSLYEKTWVGTLYEMLGIFIWAFGLDITTDAIMTAAKKIKLPDA
jgi:hypothetical protein